MPCTEGEKTRSRDSIDPRFAAGLSLLLPEIPEFEVMRVIPENVHKPPRGPKDQKNSRVRARLKISSKNEIIDRD